MTSTSARRPASVVNALRILVLCLGIELLGYAFSGNYTRGAVLGVLLGSVLVFWLLRQVHMGVRWSRFALLVIIALGLLSSLSGFTIAYGQHPGSTVIDLISTILTLIAAVLLFTKASNQWFASSASSDRRRS
ncbi:hypothetical protein [Spirosoma utsteinense]|uniref:Disulfide bond formation protein DsbB n=1 Tax=Spirosoma utsteinense TaxID=2585773 RepID=A0ABR6WEC7_9BACT|nr:hypothetical protein [Spirosoma utsteinense]MBC3788828.1 disulfide bond formation protein DsbB [Spirosoma utsteinense]MBC3794843.1 disulfide bond formation protein DsbB [Spirosoma utsteinense]